MTNELEKQFFDTFGIEPITHAVWDSTETKWKNFESWEEYPQITDRILLELMLLYPHYTCLSFCIGNQHTIENLKEDVMEEFIDMYNQQPNDEEFKHQVRTLFEEG